MKIAVVTFEFPKLTKNGGIGTAYGRLVDLLAKDGHHVSVYYVDITGVTSRFLNHGKTFFQLDSEKVRIKFIAPKVGGLANGTSWALERSIAVLKELEESKYDTIHFHDCLGLGWAYAKLHKFGLVGRRTNVVLGMHGPNFWVRDAHRKPTADLNE
ncbi:MAG: glycosyltransferase, partial [Pseudobdellovibrionaceae bacterium]